MLTKRELKDLREYYNLKAYYIEVNNVCELVGEVVFAKSEEQAKQQAWRLDTGDYSAEDVDRVEREPQFDKYIKLGYVPAKELYNYHWSFNCWECERKVSLSEEDEYEYDLEEWNKLTEEEREGQKPPIIYNPQFEGKYKVWCSLECQLEWNQKRANLKELKGIVQKELEETYPDCTIRYTGGEYDSQVVSFELTVPGLQYKVNYSSDKPDTVLVSNCDIEAWEKYRFKT